jgi:hypothetical protein
MERAQPVGPRAEKCLKNGRILEETYVRVPETNRPAWVQSLVRRQGPDGGWNTATTADRARANAAGVRTPTERVINPA